MWWLRCVSDVLPRSVWSGNGDGTFDAPLSYASQPSVRSIAVGDITNDGINNVVVSALGNTNIRAYIQGGTSGGGSRTSSATITTYENLLLSEVDLSSIARATAAVAASESMANTIATAQARVGASLSRASYALVFTESTELTAAEGYSKIVTIDAAEVAQLTAAIIRRDTAPAILAQANQSRYQVLALLPGILSR